MTANKLICVSIFTIIIMWSARASKIYYNELSSRFLCVGPISTYYFTHNAIQTAAAYGSSLNQPLHGLYPKGPVQRCFNYLVYTALTLSCAYSYLLTVFYSYTVFWSPNLCFVSTTSTLDFSLIRQQGKAWGGKKPQKKTTRHGNLVAERHKPSEIFIFFANK